jgi:hypothetical protein
MKPPKKCPITGKEMRPIFTRRIMDKYDVAYFYCEESGIIQTEEPYWLQEAYQSVIFPLDTSVASRNYGNARRLEPILSLLFPADSVFVDTASGYGLLTRLMRDIGFKFFAHDEFCENLFSKPFEAQPGTRAAALSAFEVLEHLTNPVEFLSAQMKNFDSEAVIASTTVFHGPIPDFNWAYYSFESGQHITLYQPRSLDLIARLLGGRYFRLGPDLHLITRRPVPAWKLFVLTTPVIRKAHRLATRYLRRHRSLTASDYEALRSARENPKSQIRNPKQIQTN